MTDIKLNKALDLLQNPELSVSDIAYKIAYADKSIFFRLFKEKYHVTPALYRSQHFYF